MTEGIEFNKDEGIEGVVILNTEGKIFKCMKDLVNYLNMCNKEGTIINTGRDRSGKLIYQVKG